MPESVRNMRFVFINGREEHFTTREVLALFRHPASITTLVAGGALIIWARPYEGITAFGMAQVVIYWGLLLPATFVAWLLSLLLLGHAFRTSYSIIAHLAAAAFCAVLASLLQHLMLNYPSGLQDRLEAFGFTLVATCGIELFMVTYLARRLTPHSARPRRLNGQDGLNTGPHGFVPAASHAAADAAPVLAAADTGPAGRRCMSACWANPIRSRICG